MSATPSVTPSAITGPAVVFDLDGTLIDSAPDICQVANTLLAREGAAPITLAQTRSFVGEGAPMFVTRMRAARDIGEDAQDRLLAGFLDLYEDAVTLTEPFPGVVQALTNLRAAGCRMGVCTNKPIGPTRAVLAHLGLDGYLQAVIGGDSLVERKPDPAPLHAAFEALGGGVRIYVGDSETDAETARRAAVPFLLFTEGYRKRPVEELPHAARFDDFSVLAELVRKFGK